jgi:NADPH-dependent 2,4-dienoyl-CoA reductase/sulfur reductase-like enzyme
MAKIVIVGGGWAGTGAALAARMSGAEVLLLERTDMLLGTGLVGGIIRNNGRFTAAEEHSAMGMGEFWQVMDANLRHRNVAFPGHEHADLYDVSIIEPAFKALLLRKGVTVRTRPASPRRYAVATRSRPCWSMASGSRPMRSWKLPVPSAPSPTAPSTATAVPAASCGARPSAGG